MCDLTVDIDAVARQFGLSQEDFGAEIGELGRLQRNGLIDFDGGTVRIPPQHRVLVRVVASVFDRYLREGPASADAPPKHSAAV